MRCLQDTRWWDRLAKATIAGHASAEVGTGKNDEVNERCQKRDTLISMAALRWGLGSVTIYGEGASNFAIVDWLHDAALGHATGATLPS